MQSIQISLKMNSRIGNDFSLRHVLIFKKQASFEMILAQAFFLYPFPIFIRRWKRLGPKRKPPCQNPGDQLYDQLCVYMMYVSVLVLNEPDI